MNSPNGAVGEKLAHSALPASGGRFESLRIIASPTHFVLICNSPFIMSHTFNQLCSKLFKANLAFYIALQLSQAFSRKPPSIESQTSNFCCHSLTAAFAFDLINFHGTSTSVSQSLHRNGGLAIKLYLNFAETLRKCCRIDRLPSLWVVAISEEVDHAFTQATP